MNSENVKISICLIFLFFGVSASIAQDDPSVEPRHNTGHYSTSNYEFYAEEPRYAEESDENPKDQESVTQNVRGRISIMPGIFVGPRGITILVDGRRAIGQHIESAVHEGLSRIADNADFFKAASKFDSQDPNQWPDGKSKIKFSSERLQQKLAKSLADEVLEPLYDSEYSAYINFSTSPPHLDNLARAEILSAIFNLNPPRDLESAEGIFKNLEANYGGFDPYTMYSYQFLAPRNFRAEFTLAGREPQELSTGLKSEASSGSTYGFFVEDLTFQELQMLMLGLFEISVNGSVDLSDAQQLVAEFDYQKLVTQLTTDFFSRRIVTESKSGRRWFKKYTRTSVETFLTHEQNSVTDSQISSGVSIQMRDFRDQRVIDKMYDFIFPPTQSSITLEELIKRHEDAMNAQGVTDEVKKLHGEYVAHLKELQANNKIDLAAAEAKFANAVVDLGQNKKQQAWINAVVSFLQVGFGGSYDSSNSLLEVRQLNNREYYEQRKRAFNALLFDTVESGLSISKAYFVEAPLIASEKGDLEEFVYDVCLAGVAQLFEPNPTPLSLEDFYNNLKGPLKKIEPLFQPGEPLGPGVPGGPYEFEKLPFKTPQAVAPKQ